MTTVPNRTGNVPCAGVIGWPIGHSRSPLIHRSWIAEHGLTARYDPIPLDPNDAERWFASFADHGLVGANVTIPHKETALRACAHVEPEAARLGAVNTLWLQDGALCGTSTDGAGFMANLDAGAPRWRDHPKANQALVLGAGGAARAIVDALLADDVERVVIVNRTTARADALATHFAKHYAQSRLTADSLDAFASYASASGLLINTTALGMTGQPSLSIPLPALAEGAAVTDIVYTPLMTDLLRAAQVRHHPIVDGLGMLLHQAMPGFERWFGIRPSVTPELRTRVIEDIAADRKE